MCQPLKHTSVSSQLQAAVVNSMLLLSNEFGNSNSVSEVGWVVVPGWAHASWAHIYSSSLLPPMQPTPPPKCEIRVCVCVPTKITILYLSFRRRFQRMIQKCRNLESPMLKQCPDRLWHNWSQNLIPWQFTDPRSGFSWISIFALRRQSQLGFQYHLIVCICIPSFAKVASKSSCEICDTIRTF